jgi:hypothetical protein
LVSCAEVVGRDLLAIEMKMEIFSVHKCFQSYLRTIFFELYVRFGFRGSGWKCIVAHEKETTKQDIEMTELTLHPCFTQRHHKIKMTTFDIHRL